MNGAISPVQASLACGTEQLVSANRMPATPVVGAPLTPAREIAESLWQAVRGGAVIIDSPATLSAVV